jgi:hypothetical protein
MELSETELQELYGWIDTIPLSRRKKNLARDFSDGVLMAEVVANFFPRLVELHNYEQGLKIDTKIYNWKTLNNRVFKKLSYSLDQETMSGLANSVPGVIERVLIEIRQVMMTKLDQEQNPFNDDAPDHSLEEEIDAARACTDRHVLDAKVKQVKDQQEQIALLEERISKIEDLIQMKEASIQQLSKKVRKPAK